MLCAGAALVLLASCSGGGGGSEVEVDADAGAGVELADFEWVTEGVDRDATLKFGTFAPMGSADPHAAGATVSTVYFNLMYDRLFWVTKDSQLRGYLVEDWEFVEDGLVLTLRDDATFQDGSPVDAEAVKANIDRARGAEFSAYQNALSTIEDTEVVDDVTVLLRTAPNAGATLPYVLGGWAGMIINPEFLDPETLRTSAPRGVGSGPYEVVSWTPGEDTTVFERAEDHWDPAAGQVARIEVVSTPDFTQLINAVATQAYDAGRIGNDTAITAIDRAEADAENLQTGELLAGNSVNALWMRDLVDPTVREAIGYAIDREALAAVYEGGAVVANQLFGEGHPAHTDAIDEFTQTDTDRAGQLVEDAPAGSTSLTMGYAESPLETRLAQVIQAQLSAVGIELELSPMTHSSLYQAWFEGQFDLVLAGTAGPNHASTGIDASLLRGGTGWGAPDSALADIEAELERADDPALGDEERNEIYHGILTQAAEERWVVPFAQMRNVMLTSSSLVNVESALPMQYQSLEDYRYVAVKAD